MAAPLDKLRLPMEFITAVRRSALGLWLLLGLIRLGPAMAGG